MNKDEHILRVLTKIKHKKYEHFAISRIMHKIFDTDIKFVCQQLVRRPNGRGNALLDIYFPQLNISLEIDEPQHESPVHKASDKERMRDIITVADLIEKRISVLDSGVPSLAKTARETDQFLELLLATAEKAALLHGSLTSRNAPFPRRISCGTREAGAAKCGHTVEHADANIGFCFLACEVARL